MAKTSLDPESHAYPSGRLDAGRKGKLLCPDGIVRTAQVGIPDTFFSIPARLKVRGRTVAGFVTREDGEYLFNPTGKNKDVFRP